MNPADLTFFAIIAVFLLFIIYSNSVVVGAKVVMLGGITGRVSAINEETIVIESTPGNKIEFVKAAVRNVIDSAPEPASKTKAQPAKKSTKAAPKTSK
jgi:preprotein translocase subunit YajC